MACYVDDVNWRFGQMTMCHLWADTLEELLAMVDAIGVQHKWIQGHPTLSFGKHRNASWVHFDIAKSKKELALQRGAILTDKYGPSEHTSRLKLTHPDPAARARARHMIDTIARIRAERSTTVTDNLYVPKLSHVPGEWEEEQASAAMSEGWCLYEDEDGLHRVKRLPSGPFPSDRDAWNHVLSQTAMGHATATYASRLHGTPWRRQ